MLAPSRNVSATLLGTALLLVFASSSAEAQRTPEQVLAALEAADHSREPYPRNLLSSLFGFDRDHMARLDRGEVVIGNALFDDGDEVAAVGAIRVRGDRDTFIRTMHPSWRYRNGSGNTQMGVFSASPRVADLAGLTLDDGTVEDIRKCRPGDCDVQLSRTGMAHVREGVDFGAPDAEAQILRRVKQFAVEYLQDYRNHGFTGLEPYEDSRRPVDRVAEFRGVMGHAMVQADQEPFLHRYLESYPRTRHDGVEDTFYWIRQEGNAVMDPTFMLVHGVTWTDPANPGRVSMVDKLLYASHYVVASLGETMVVPDPHVEDGFYVIRMQRARFHVGGGLAHGVIMNRVHAGLRSGIESELDMARRVARR